MCGIYPKMTKKAISKGRQLQRFIALYGRVMI